VRETPSTDTVRIDVWLDVACLFKTRSEAKRACEGGKVTVNDEQAKPHRLIREGATLVTRVEDVLDALAPALRSRLAAVRAASEASRLTATERRVLDALGGEATHVDDVVGRSGAAAGDVLETLLALELRRLVDQRPGMRFVRRGAA